MEPSSRERTSLRSRPAGHTAAVGRRLMRRLGISRVLDITGLDGIGMPVAVSIRPEGRTARTHAGKGIRSADARVGALMEAIECAVAEQAAARGPYVRVPLGQLAAQLPPGLALTDFAPRLDAELATARLIPAVRCGDLMSRARPLLPAELVMVPPPDEPDQAPLFGWSSNGLASGSTLQEATLHALLEVLERDTVAMSAARRSAARVDPMSLPPAFALRAGRWHELGVRLFVRWLPGDFGLPCFEATLFDPGHPHAELARGWGIHLDRGIALARAVSEAAQVRLCSIHGAQPGMAGLYGGRLRPAAGASSAAGQRFLSELAAAEGVDFHRAPHGEHRGIGIALAEVLDRMRAAGFHHAFRYRMRPRDGQAALAGLHVVKVVVPRCETIQGSASRAGPRLVQAASMRV